MGKVIKMASGGARSMATFVYQHSFLPDQDQVATLLKGVSAECLIKNRG